MPSGDKDTPNGRFVVGLDFGTTFTSVAFAHSTSPDEIKLVQTWPKGSTNSGTADQVPTELHYTDPTSREFVWGYEISKARRDAVVPLKWFKLLLQNGSTISPGSTSMIRGTDAQRSASNPTVKTLAKLGQIGKTPVHVVEDFLSSVRKVALESMSNTYGQVFVDSSEVEYVITVPAIWSDAAKASMVQAAELANYGQHRRDFHLVSEPEAAAAYTLKAIQPHDLRQSDTFIICDAGGGTVDLISYKVQSLDPLRVVEVVGGTGDLCGSVYLDDGFKAYMTRKMGPATLNRLNDRQQLKIETSWETLKQSFGLSKSDEVFEVDVPGIPDSTANAVDEGYHTMTHGQVVQIYKPVVDRVVALIKHQVDTVEAEGHKVSSVMLVGGFGGSAYLLDRLKAQRFGHTASGVQIIQPVNARTAIARGALLRGLDGSIVKEKRARRWYGTALTVPYHNCNHREDLETYKEWDSLDGSWRVPGKLTWNIKKGEVLTKDHFVDLQAYQDISVKNPNFEIWVTIMISEDNAPVEYSWQSETSVQKLCKLKADISKVPSSEFPQRKNEDGKFFYKVYLAVRATILDDVLKFELIYNGKAYGEVSAKYE